MNEVNMKFSDETVAILRNFSTINPSLVFRRGNVIRTISKQESIIAQATVGDKFDDSFTIYDLNRFLSVLSSMSEPDIKIYSEEKSLTIADSNSKSKVRYGLSDEVLVVSPPEDDIEIGDAKIKFTLTAEDFSRVIKMGGVMGLPNIVVMGDREKISIAAVDVKNEDSDIFSIDVGETTSEFKTIFSYENLRIINDTYDVAISTDGISHFSRKKGNLDYWIATEAGSSYSE